MNVDQRRALLGELAGLDHREAENLTFPERRFLPLASHTLALRPEIVIVRGGRGAGKSALFGLLKRLRTTEGVRRFFADVRLPAATWMDAFDQGKEHPDVLVIDSFAEDQSESALRVFWMCHLLMRIDQEKPGLVDLPADLRAAWTVARNDLRRWVPLAQAHVGTLASYLDRVEQHLEARGETLFATYDHLDRIGAFSPAIRRRCVSSLLALWLSLSNRYQMLRAKIFLREDLLDAGELGFPDASKLRARSVAIEWDVESLYRVTVRQMAATEGLREWLRGVKNLMVEERGEYGFFPGPMGKNEQKAFADRLAGEVMGAGAKKGYTYRWIPGHLRDAQDRVVPRSMLVLLGQAAREALKNPLQKGTRLVTPQNLTSALAETSTQRVGEIVEEYKLVNRMNHLAEMHLLLSQKEVIERISRPIPDEPPGLSVDGQAVFEELVRLGVLAVRADGRVDVPDIYRFGFKIKRKGGAQRLRA